MAAAWNGISSLAPLKAANLDLEVTSDTSGNWGCGAFSSGKWFQLQWDDSMTPVHITVKELIPIVIAAMLWVHKWVGKTVRALCGNMAIVRVLTIEQRSRNHALVQCQSLVFSP